MISYARLNFSVPNVGATKESLNLGVYCGLFYITLHLKLSRESSYSDVNGLDWIQKSN